MNRLVVVQPPPRFANINQYDGGACRGNNDIKCIYNFFLNCIDNDNISHVKYYIFRGLGGG